MTPNSGVPEQAIFSIINNLIIAMIIMIIPIIHTIMMVMIMMLISMMIIRQSITMLGRKQSLVGEHNLVTADYLEEVRDVDDDDDDDDDDDKDDCCVDCD